MKKLAYSILLLLASSCALEALPLGNPAEPLFLPQGVIFAPCRNDNSDPCCLWIRGTNLRAGFYGDFVFNRRLKLLDGGASLHDTRVVTNAGYVVINFANRVDVFATAGVSKIKIIDQTEETWGTTSVLSEESIGTIETNTDFSWSFGARAILLRIFGFTLGAEGQYFQINPRFNRYHSTFLTGNAVYFHSGSKVRYKEWQGGLGLSYIITCRDPCWTIIPYGGVKWSWVHFDTHNFSFIVPDSAGILPARTLTIFDLRVQHNTGYVAGVTLTGWGNSALTVEGRWYGETALYVNAQFRF